MSKAVILILIIIILGMIAFWISCMQTFIVSYRYIVG